MPSMTSEDLHIPLGTGIEVPAYRATPAGTPILASVLVLAEIWSVNPNMRSICDRLAQNGVAALAPTCIAAASSCERDPAKTRSQITLG